jgi:hypothetical protein
MTVQAYSLESILGTFRDLAVVKNATVIMLM